MRWGWLLPIAALGAAGAGYYFFFGKKGREAITYTTAPISLGSIEEEVTATGTLSAVTTVTVGSQVSGTVKALYADFNDVVTKGQLLAELDPATFEAQLAQAKASLSTAQAQQRRARARLNEAEKAQKRARDLAQKELISQAELETAEAALESARADLQSADAQLSEARAALKLSEVNLSRTKIYSPIDGIVISRQVDVGQTVAASLSAPELFLIAEDLRKMHLIANVAEADIGKLKEGTEVSFTVEAFPGETFRGILTQLRYNPVTVSNVVTYDAVITVENESLKLRPGMTAQARVITQRRENTLLIPGAALRFTPPQGVELAAAGFSGKAPRAKGERQGEREKLAPGTMRAVVYTQEGGQLRPVPVVIGISTSQAAELIKGDLKEGDQVVTGTDQPGGGGRGGRGGGFRRMRL